MHNRAVIKAMIELAEDWEAADKILSEFTFCKTENEKCAYILGMFDVSVVGHDPLDGQSYPAILNSVVNAKWR